MYIYYVMYMSCAIRKKQLAAWKLLRPSMARVSYFTARTAMDGGIGAPGFRKEWNGHLGLYIPGVGKCPILGILDITL